MIIKNKGINEVNPANSAKENESLKLKQNQKKATKSFYAGNVFGNDKQMQMANKKAAAQKEAVRSLVHQQIKDLKTAKIKDDIVAEQKGFFDKISDSESKLYDLVHDRNNLDDEYQIKDNEKSDAKLMDKADRIINGSNETFTDQEKNRISRLTEYADKIQSISDNITEYTNRIYKSKNGIMSDNMQLLEYQKVQQSDMGMEKAKQKATQIMKAFSSDAIQSMLKQVKDKTDDDTQKTEEKALEKEAKDEQTKPAATKEQEKQNVQNKEEKKDAVLTKAIVKQDIQSDNIQTQIKIMVKKENISLDILKGLDVDKKA